MPFISKKYQSFGLGQKLAIANFVLVSVVLAVLIGLIGFFVSKNIEQRAEDDLAKHIKMMVSFLEASDADLYRRAEFLGKSFAKNLPGIFEVSAEKMTIKDRQVSILKLNGTPININYQVVDNFTQNTGAIATVFVKDGNDFIRVTTSLKNEKASPTMFAKALLESNMKKFNVALDYYNQAIVSEPEQTFYYINRGALQAEMIDFISSIESNVQVLTLDDAGATRAKVQEKSSKNYDYSSAIQDMKKAAALAPEFPYIYYNLGNLYCLSNNLPESIKQYDKALELFPNIAEAYYNRGLVLIYLKDKEKGCFDLSKAGELGLQDAYVVIKKYCIKEDN